MEKKTSTIDIEGHKFEIDLYKDGFQVESEFNITRMAHHMSMGDIEDMVEVLVRQGMSLKEQQFRAMLGIK